MTLEELTNEDPITLSAEAAKQIRTASEQEHPSIRVAVRGGGCSGFEYALDFDDARETDITYRNQGIEIAVDPISLRYLRGTEIDYKGMALSGGFVFNNPNAKGSCGCGTSFSVD